MKLFVQFFVGLKNVKNKKLKTLGRYSSNLESTIVYSNGNTAVLTYIYIKLRESPAHG